MIGITKQLPRMAQPVSILRYRGMVTRQMHQSLVVSIFRKNKKGEQVISGGSGVDGGLGGGVSDGVSGDVSHDRGINGNGNMSVEKHPILKRMPKFMLPYTKNFIHAPVSHVTAFLILHELSAIVPLVGIWYVFHKYQWSIPLDLPSWAIDKGTHIIDKSMAQFDFRNFSFQEKANFIMEGAYAYVIVKGLFPVRIIFSVLLMPSFAKYFVIPFTRMFSFRKRKQPKVPEVEPKKEGSEITQKKVTKPRL
ncbi:unnamed protein product [Debaryomyces tyrocola]|nr:unnamed protein product [Debaryomyces tyrocola]